MIEFGPYILSKVCTECDWFQNPSTITRKICPACGSPITEAVGRYKYIRHTGTIKFYSWIEWIDFIRKLE